VALLALFSQTDPPRIDRLSKGATDLQTLRV
jgi:hypothetical protein